jgi:hypothetical protein
MSLGRTLVMPDGEAYQLVLLLVDSRRSDGTPLQCRIIRDEDTIKLSENPQDNVFMTAYVPKKMMKQ